MAVYKNRNTDSKSIFRSVDFDDVHNTAFSIVKNEVDVEKAKKILADAGEKFVAQAYVKGQTVIITQGDLGKEEFLKKISTLDGDKFEQESPKKQTSLEFVKKHGWKLRGGSSIVGQSMTFFSALRTPDYEYEHEHEIVNGKSVVKKDSAGEPVIKKDHAGKPVIKKDLTTGERVVKENPKIKGKLKTTFDPSTGMFAALNLAANFINLIFGGQKEEDVKGLEKFNTIIADEVNRYLPNDVHSKISPDDVRKLSYMNEKELEEHNKDRSAAGILKRNSVKLGEVGLRTLGSIALVLNYKTVGNGAKKLLEGNIKEAWKIAKIPDDFTRIAGYGMVAGKAMGLAAETYDPKDPPKTYWADIRQKVLWRVSSFTEMISQGSMVYDRHKNKKMVIGNKLRADNVGAVGNVLLTVPPYPARLVLPYGEKVIDVKEVQARLLDELPKIPQDKVPEVAARVTSRMVEYLGDNSPEFSQLYREVINKLDKFHDVKVLPYRVEDSSSAQQSATKFVDKIPAKEAPASATAAGRIQEIIKDGSAANHSHVIAAEQVASDASMVR